MVDQSLWAKMVVDAEMALASDPGRPLDSETRERAQRILQTEALVTRSRDIYSKTVELQQRSLASVNDALTRVHDRMQRVAARMADSNLVPEIKLRLLAGDF